MGQINIANGVAAASGFPNNGAVLDYIKANGTSPSALQAAAAAGAVPPAATTSPAFIGGVPVPQQTGVANPPVAAASLSSPTPPPATAPSVGGLNPTSAFSVGPTSKAEQKLATGGNGTVQTAKTFPTGGILTPPPAGESIKKFLADWYRNGLVNVDSSKGTYAIQPKSIDPFEFGETPASIRVFGPKDGKDQELIPAYTKFILESVQESHSERSQIVETFGDFYVFLFGERPPMYTFTGTLINTRNVNWVADFKFYYDNYLRGSKCAEQKARLLLTYGGRQVEGFMLSMTTATDASLEAGVKVSFPVVVTRKTFLGFSDDFGFLTEGDNLIKDADFIALLDKIAGVEGTGTSKSATSQAAVAASQSMAASAPPASLISATGLPIA